MANGIPFLLLNLRKLRHRYKNCDVFYAHFRKGAGHYREKVFGSIYDDRLLIKPVPAAVRLMSDATIELPYEGAKEILLVDDVDNREFLCELVQSIWEELPEKKKRK